MTKKVYIATRRDGGATLGTTSKEVAELQIELRDAEQMLVGSWDVFTPSAAKLCQRVVDERLSAKGYQRIGEWWERKARALMADITSAFHHFIADPPAEDFNQIGRTILTLRTEVLDVSMLTMAHICGSTESTVSRWESGILEPNWSHLKRLRDFFEKFLGRPLEDDWLFRPVTAKEIKAWRKQHG